MKEKNKPLTISDIAGLAGVDKAVVSKIINNARVIPASKEKIARVKAVIEEYGYTPSSSARSLVTSRTRQLLFLLSDTTTQGIGNEVFAQSLNGVMDLCRRKGYLCQIETTDFSKIGNFILPENLRRRSVDGCILTGGFSPEALRGLASTGCPLVIIGGEYLAGELPVISRNSSVDYPEILDYCRSRGHRHLWVLTGAPGAQEKYNDYVSKYPEMKIDFINVRSFDRADEFFYGEKSAERFCMLEPEKRPDLILGTHQFCAAFAVCAARAGLKIPDDFSMISGEESALIRYLPVPLTVYGPDFFESGVKAAELLCSVIEEKISQEQAVALASKIPVSARLIERGSVKFIP